MHGSQMGREARCYLHVPIEGKVGVTNVYVCRCSTYEEEYDCDEHVVAALLAACEQKRHVAASNAATTRVP